MRGDEVWEIDPGLPEWQAGERGQRGWLGLGIKVLEFFGVDLKGQAARALGDKLEETSAQGNAPGTLPLRPGRRPSAFTRGCPSGEASAADQGPILVFIHGTGSSCQGQLRRALGEPRRAPRPREGAATALWRPGVCLGAPHASPRARSSNALELAERLPDGRRCAPGHPLPRRAGGGTAVPGRARPGRPTRCSRDLLEALFAADRTMADTARPAARWTSTRPSDARRGLRRGPQAPGRTAGAARRDDSCTIRRFVRVACPARGTTLASGRLDRWLSVLDHLAPASGLVGDAVDFLLAVVKERTDPRTLPGLEAMMPGSALTRLLQHPALVTSADLTVIAGDIEGDAPLGPDQAAAPPTGSTAPTTTWWSTPARCTAACAAREQGARFLRDQGPQGQPLQLLRERQERALAGRRAGPRRWRRRRLPAHRARPSTRRRAGATRCAAAVGPATPRPLAVVLPGTMGSALKVQAARASG